jgi:hypothetical protein
MSGGQQQFKRPAKYRNRRTVVGDITFASAKEARRYGELKLLERAGQIQNLRRQVRFSLDVNGVHVCDYLADFTFNDHIGKLVVEDAKGYATETYRLKKRLMLALLGIEIVET